MKNPGAVMAVGLTAVIVMAIGVLNVVLSARNTGPAVAEEAAAQVGDAAAVPDVAAVQAAYEARETLLALQNAQLDVELSERQKAYDSRVEELQALIGSGEEQLAQLEDQEAALQEQIDQLLLVQSERTAIYDSQRQQANAQYQVNIQQLQVQLDEGKSKLHEALARLGQ
jgi:chromosome segregation ATPase